jgi:hypothetical protein
MTMTQKVLAMFGQSVYRVTVRAWLPQADSGPQRLHQNWMTHNSESQDIQPTFRRPSMAFA